MLHPSGGTDMIRKLILPVMAAGLLAGCVTPGYQYRTAGGEHYRGQSGVRAVPYGTIGYGTRTGVYGRVGYGVGYGYPYGYGAGYGVYPAYPVYPGYYGYPAHPYYPRPYHPGRPVVVHPRPDAGQRPVQGRPPWRDLDRMRDNQSRQHHPRSGRPQAIQPQMQQPATPAARPQQPRGAMRAVYSDRAQDAASRTRTIEP